MPQSNFRYLSTRKASRMVVMKMMGAPIAETIPVGIIYKMSANENKRSAFPLSIQWYIQQTQSLNYDYALCCRLLAFRFNDKYIQFYYKSHPHITCIPIVSFSPPQRCSVHETHPHCAFNASVAINVQAYTKQTLHTHTHKQAYTQQQKKKQTIHPCTMSKR